MKTIIGIFILIIIACANLAFTQVQQMYGAPQAQPTYGAPQQMYGAQQPQPTYGAPQVQQPQPTYGTPQAQQYGPAQVQPYGAPRVQTPMYDNSYSGLFNMYGQPTFVAPEYQPGAQQQAQQQQGQDGLIFKGASAVQSVGGYLWSYMPAPLRGADAGYFAPAGTGPTIINFTPGTR
ncbi:MAG: hypothetical protein ACLQPD_25220 [Desulfomonilaceae bacterium]